MLRIPDWVPKEVRQSIKETGELRFLDEDTRAVLEQLTTDDRARISLNSSVSPRWPSFLAVTRKHRDASAIEMAVFADAP